MFKWCQHFNRRVTKDFCNNRLKTGFCLCNVQRESDVTNQKAAGKRDVRRIPVDMERLKRLYDSRHETGRTVSDIARILRVNRWTIAERLRELEGGR